MKNRFLSATTALSVVLASLHPLPVIAQDSRTLAPCVPGEGDCAPRERKKQEKKQEKAKEVRKSGQGSLQPSSEQREGENRPGASDEAKQARQQQRKEKAREQAKEQEEAEDAAERRKERNAERKQAEDRRQEERQQNRNQEANSAERQKAEDALRQSRQPEPSEGTRAPRASDRAGDEGGASVAAREQQARESNQRKQEADRQSDETPVARQREENAGNRQARREQREQPSEEEVRRLDRLLDDRDGEGRVEAASDERRQSRRVIERRLTEDDTRSSDEDFRRDRNPRNNDDNDDDDDDDDGLSDLQKFGLLALGGLAVGALLNNNRRVVSNSGDRVVVQDPDGSYTVLRDDDTLIRQPGSDVSTESFNDGSTRTTVTRADGSRIVTIRDASGRVLQRTRINPNGQEVYLIDDLAPVEEVDFSRLPPPDPNFRISTSDNGESLRDALARIEGRDAGRRFSLRQIRDYREVRELAPAIDIAQITFATGSAAIDASEAERLADLGHALTDLIAEKPNEMFLIEGHTDAVGSAAANLALSDQRAESVALALTEYFDVPPENLVVQGYGEGDLLIDSDGPELRNRRVAARLITPLLQQAALE